MGINKVEKDYINGIPAMNNYNKISIELKKDLTGTAAGGEQRKR